MSRSALNLILALLLCLGTWVAHASVLDESFGSAGLAWRPEFGSSFRPMGACPHPNGSVTIVGNNQVGEVFDVVMVRMKADGALDTSFSGDGIHQLPGLALNLSGNFASACSGLATADASDDRLTLFTTAGAFLRSFQIQLEQGQYAGSYCGGNYCSIDVNTAFGLPQFSPGIAVVRGLQPGSDGQWLLTGQYQPDGAPSTRGFLFRFDAAGALNGSLVPAFPDTTAVELASAYEQDGVIRFLAVLQTQSGFQVAQGRTDTAFNSTMIDAQSASLTSRPTLGKGRFIGNQTLVAPILLSSQSSALAVARPGQLHWVALPSHLIGVDAFISQSFEQNLAATASGSNGVLVAASMQDGEGLGAAPYLARVDLRPATPQVDLDFGNLGSARISWQPAASACQPGENAWVALSGVVSWQEANIVLGSSRSNCPWSSDFSLLAMRVKGAPMLSDGFE